MSKHELRDALTQLYAEIEKLQDEDSEVKDRLNELIKDIEEQIEGEGDELHADTLIDKLQLQIEQFETEHPRVTGILNQLMLTLSNMGI